MMSQHRQEGFQIWNIWFEISDVLSAVGTTFTPDTLYQITLFGDLQFIENVLSY